MWIYNFAADSEAIKNQGSMWMSAITVAGTFSLDYLASESLPSLARCSEKALLVDHVYADPTWPQASATDYPHLHRVSALNALCQPEEAEEDSEELSSVGLPKHLMHRVFLARSSGVQTANDVMARPDKVHLHQVGRAELCRARAHSS